MNYQSIAEKNIKFLVSIGIEAATFNPTTTGLEKSILDATVPVRFLFERNNFHDYQNQDQGSEGKIIKKAYFVSTTIEECKLSLYRPNTKSGDPRMWFSNLKTFAKPGDIVAIVFFRNCPYLFNLSNIEFSQLSPSSEILKLINCILEQNNSAASELLEELQRISHTPLAAIKKGDTAIGHSIETALGISANSSQNPDFKGIEIKSGRSQKNRTTLFAQVPNWEISVLKSSREILEKFGRSKDSDYRLYCTLSSKQANSHGLFLKYNHKERLMEEWHSTFGHVASWNEETLIQRLLLKHRETFWIEANVEIIRGTEYFHLKAVEHTKNPVATQLMPLISEGIITMDHLIKKSGSTKTKVTEKGPLFKIHKSNLDLLFPSRIKYYL
jgi:MvaI/BcnI restriction endonuclease family